MKRCSVAFNFLLVVLLTISSTLCEAQRHRRTKRRDVLVARANGEQGQQQERQLGQQGTNHGSSGAAVVGPRRRRRLDGSSNKPASDGKDGKKKKTPKKGGKEKDGKKHGKKSGGGRGGKGTKPDHDHSDKPTSSKPSKPHPDERYGGMPIQSFDISNCLTYNTYWMMDLTSSCDNPQVVDDSCACPTAELLIRLDKLDCAPHKGHMYACPEDCDTCKICMVSVLNCQDIYND